MAQKDQVDQAALAAEWGLALDADAAENNSAAPAEAGAPAAPAAAAPAAAGDSQWGAPIEDLKFEGNGKGGTERVLTQEEIDSLLGFSLTDVSMTDNSGIRAIIDSAMVSYERLPLSLIHI